MKRDQISQLRSAFEAGAREVARHSDTVVLDEDETEEAFRDWLVVADLPRWETVMERGTRVHQEVEAMFRGTIVMELGPYAYAKGDYVKLAPGNDRAVIPCTEADDARIGNFLDRLEHTPQLGSVRVDVPRHKAVLMTHDDVIAEFETSSPAYERALGVFEPWLKTKRLEEGATPTKDDRVDALVHGLYGLTNGVTAPILPSWRCHHYACPERAPTASEHAPTCYTCGKPMAQVDNATSIAALADRMAKEFQSFPLPVKAEPYLGHEWKPLQLAPVPFDVETHNVKPGVWGPSPLTAINEAARLKDAWLKAWPDAASYFADMDTGGASTRSGLRRAIGLLLPSGVKDFMIHYPSAGEVVLDLFAESEEIVRTWPSDLGARLSLALAVGVDLRLNLHYTKP